MSWQLGNQMQVITFLRLRRLVLQKQRTKYHSEAKVVLANI